MREQEDRAEPDSAVGAEGLGRLEAIAKLSAVEEPFPAQAEIDAADEIVANEKLGAIDTPFTIPFSSQFKAEARKRYPVDDAFYGAADRIESKTLRYYCYLRLFEIASYALFLALAAGFVFWLGEEDALSKPPGGKIILDSPRLALLFGVTVSFFVAVGLRLAARWWAFKEIHEAARDMSYSFYSRYKDIMTKVMEYGHRAQSRTGSGGSWQERAHDWIKASLWNGERAEYLSRYSTAVSWRIHFRIGALEALSWFVMAVAFAFFSAVLFLCVPETPIAAILFIVMGAASFLGWGPFDRRKAAFWTEEFRKTFSDDEFACTHHFNVVPDVVRDLVSTIIANDRNAVA